MQSEFKLSQLFQKRHAKNLNKFSRDFPIDQVCNEPEWLFGNTSEQYKKTSAAGKVQLLHKMEDKLLKSSCWLDASWMIFCQSRPAKNMKRQQNVRLVIEYQNISRFGNHEHTTVLYCLGGKFCFKLISDCINELFSVEIMVSRQPKLLGDTKG